MSDQQSHEHVLVRSRAKASVGRFLRLIDGILAAGVADVVETQARIDALRAFVDYAQRLLDKYLADSGKSICADCRQAHADATAESIKEWEAQIAAVIEAERAVQTNLN